MSARRQATRRAGGVVGGLFARFIWWLVKRRVKRAAAPSVKKHYDYEVKR